MSLPARSPVAKACDDVVVGAELSCTTRGAGKREMTIALRPATTDETRVDYLTLLVGGLPVEVGGRRDATVAQP